MCFLKKVFTFLCLFSFLTISLANAQANRGQQIKKALQQTFELATAAYQNKNYDQAINLYKKAIGIYPSFAPAHYHMALCYKAKGDQYKMIDHLKQTVSIQDTHEAAHEELAKVYYAVGEFDLAETHGLKTLELNPNNISAELTVGWTYLMGKSMGDEAIDYFESALEKQKIAYAYLGLGMAYFMTDQRPKVLEMVTFLRQNSKEDLALQLEAMIRDPSRAPRSIPGEPLFSAPRRKVERKPPPQQYPDVAESDQIKSMPVRLSAPLGVSPTTPQTSSSHLSGADRIRQMQERQRKGSY